MKYNPTGLAHIGVPCADIHKTIDFYKEFGFEVTAIAENLNGFDVVMLQNGTCTIEAYHPLDEETVSYTHLDVYKRQTVLSCFVMR